MNKHKCCILWFIWYYTILPEIIQCKEFVNADEIAKGLSPFQPEKVAFEAGRIMNKIIKAKKNGYSITLLFFWLKNVDLAKERVIPFLP